MPSIYTSWLTEAERTAKTEDEQQSVVRQLQEDYRDTFKTAQGQRVLADLIRRSRMMQYSFCAETNEKYWRDGRVDLVKEVINMIVVTPEAAERLVTTGETSAVFEQTGNQNDGR